MPPRGPGWTDEEAMFLLTTMERILPTNTSDWTRVHNAHAAQYPVANRAVASLQRKFNDLARTREPTGNPNIPETVQRAYKILQDIRDKNDGSTGSPSDNEEGIDFIGRCDDDDEEEEQDKNNSGDLGEDYSDGGGKMPARTTNNNSNPILDDRHPLDYSRSSPPTPIRGMNEWRNRLGSTPSISPRLTQQISAIGAKRGGKNKTTVSSPSPTTNGFSLENMMGIMMMQQERDRADRTERDVIEKRERVEREEKAAREREELAREREERRKHEERREEDRREEARAAWQQQQQFMQLMMMSMMGGNKRGRDNNINNEDEDMEMETPSKKNTPKKK